MCRSDVTRIYPILLCIINQAKYPIAFVLYPIAFVLYQFAYYEVSIINLIFGLMAMRVHNKRP